MTGLTAEDDVRQNVVNTQLVNVWSLKISYVTNDLLMDFRGKELISTPFSMISWTRIKGATSRTSRGAWVVYP